MILEFALAAMFGLWQAAGKSDAPLASATDPAYLSCYVWNGHEWSAPTARSARTPVLTSSKGFRAYAKVDATFTGASCENTIKLYVSAAAGQRFKVVYTKGPSDSGGNGIHLLGWSPDGNKLLAQVNAWEYETDLGYGRLGLIYKAPSRSARELEGLNAALSLHFGKDCEFDFSVDRWRTNDQLLVKITKALEDESYEQHFCVEQPVKLLFDLQKGTLQPTQSRRQNHNRKTP